MWRRGPLAGSTAATLAVGLGVLAAVGPGPLAPRRQRWNVVLVSIDTLRADHLGCYGYDRPTSPMIDAFSRDAVLFEEAIAAAPSTLASHASLFTSLVVPHHGVLVAGPTRLADDAETLAEVLSRSGYETASWNGGLQLDPRFGLDQGFELYRSAPAGESDVQEDVLAADHLENQVRASLDWIDRRDPAPPFFLFVHSYEAHHPYTPRADLRALFGSHETRLETDDVSVPDLIAFNQRKRDLQPGDLGHIVAGYDAEIRSTDEAFGVLVDGLSARGLLDRTLVVLTSDHGEEFGEHGMVGWHSHTLFDELLRVPLILRLPQRRHAGSRIEAQVGGIDLAPTVLDLVGVKAPPVFQGHSLVGLMDGTSDAGQLVLSARDTPRFREVVSLRGGGWKWIRDHGLFDLGADPGETSDVSRGTHEERARRRALKRRAESWVDSRQPTAASLSLDPDISERLRALGYIE